MKTIRLRACELFHDTTSSSGTTLEPQAFPVTVHHLRGETVCSNVEELATLLWAEPDAARIFTSQKECQWYVQNWCAPFGKRYTRQERKPDSCILEMYQSFAF